MFRVDGSIQGIYNYSDLVILLMFRVDGTLQGIYNYSDVVPFFKLKFELRLDSFIIVEEQVRTCVIYRRFSSSGNN